MKDHNFKIKIGDLLINPSSSDTVELRKKFSTKIPQLTDGGVNADVGVVGLDEKTVLITIEEVKCNIKDSCDICGKDMNYKLKTSGETVKVFVGDESSDEFNDDGDTIYLDDGASVVDIEDFLIDSLLLKDSVRHVCENCEDRDVKDTKEEPIGEVKRDFSSDS